MMKRGDGKGEWVLTYFIVAARGEIAPKATFSLPVFSMLFAVAFKNIEEKLI